MRNERSPQTLGQTALHRAAVALVQYYAALRLSAGAATTLLPPDVRAQPAPIVRSARVELYDGFDRREIIIQSGRPHVITIDLVSATQHDPPACYPN